MAALDPQTLQTWLEWAGARLIAMPGPRTGPKEPKAFWPFEYDHDRFQVLEFRRGLAARAMAPSAKEIPMMEEILTFPNMCSHETTRRIIHDRLLMHPIKMTHLYTWADIAKTFKMKTYKVSYLHKLGLMEICEKAKPEHVCRIATSFNNFA